MKARSPDRHWIPFWTEKWLFGSMRIEFNAEERGIWIDLLALANKDEGWIRANEETAYPIEQLSGMLMIPKDNLANALTKFHKKKKLKICLNGCIYITNWKKYSFTDRHRRRVMSGKKDKGGQKADTRKEKKRVEKNRKENIEDEFEEFWKAYREMGSEKQKKNYIGNKQEALKEYKSLRKRETKETIVQAFNGYVDFLKYQRLVEHFEPKKKYVTTFLRSERWKEHIDFKYEPGL